MGESYMFMILYIEDIEVTLIPHHKLTRPVRRDT